MSFIKLEELSIVDHTVVYLIESYGFELCRYYNDGNTDPYRIHMDFIRYDSSREKVTHKINVYYYRNKNYSRYRIDQLGLLFYETSKLKEHLSRLLDI